jgi:hypothetical protein
MTRKANNGYLGWSSPHRRVSVGPIISSLVPRMQQPHSCRTITPLLRLDNLDLALAAIAAAPGLSPALQLFCVQRSRFAILDMAATFPGTDGTAPSFKRPRATQACECCRARKVRCNINEQSPCSNCLSLRVTCVPAPRRRSVCITSNRLLGINHLLTFCT